jgi:hypothetical protein
MEGKWAIVNNDMIVVYLFDGDLLTFNWTSIERYGGEVNYSEPFEYRGIPTIGSIWSNELDKFVTNE